MTELKAIHLRLEWKVPLSTQLHNIVEKIDFIAVVGTLLHLLVKSQVIKKRLYSIIGFLSDRAAAIQAKVDKKMDDDHDNDQQDRDDEEDGLYRDDEEDEDELEGASPTSLLVHYQKLVQSASAEPEKHTYSKIAKSDHARNIICMPVRMPLIKKG